MTEIRFLEPKVKLISHSHGHVSLPAEYEKIVAALNGGGKPELAKEVENLSCFGPTHLVVYGAKGCRSSLTPTQIYRNELLKHLKGLVIEDPRNFSESDLSKIKSLLEKGWENMLNQTVGSGHLGVLDQASYNFENENVPRVVTLFTCASEYASHLQQSLRIIEPTGAHIPKVVRGTKFQRKLERIFEEDLELYRQMRESEVPAEDARYALAIYSTTNDQLSINARELTYLKLLAKETVPEVVRRVIGQIVEEASKVSPGFFEDRGENCNILNYFPASQLFGGTNPNIKRYREHFNRTETVFVGYSGIELEDLSGAIKNKRTSELADLKHIHFTFLAPESLASFHQSTRQRTWNQSVETLSQSLTKKSRVTPAGVRERGYVTRFEESVQRKYDIYEDMLEEGLPPNEIGGVVAHAHVVYVLIHLNGWNVIKSLPSRRCDKVQWEIRESADEMARIIDVLNPELGYFSQPNCRRFGYCRERNPCEKKDIYLRSFKMGLS